MSRLLVWLSLLFAGTVVGILATYLILIATALIRANRNLARIAGGLEAVRDNTAPLAEDLTSINTAAAALRDRLGTVDEHLRLIVRSVRT